MSEMTARLTLPLIVPGQSQKELFHNEALARLDLLGHAAVVATGATVPPTDPVEGQCWLLGDGPTGAWAGHDRAIAGWTAGGWRFVAATEGMAVWTGPATGTTRFTGGSWSDGGLYGTNVTVGGTQVVGAQKPAIVDPEGGMVADAEARAAIGAILDTLREHGLIAQ